ncbi:hypothetical protein ZWY2020_023213 [Hordeum vulgare]|nr:hypothetical protein ZWY2020_023213 [Hordeum vulgare]
MKLTLLLSSRAMRKRLSSPSNRNCSDGQKTCYILASYQLTNEWEEAVAQGSKEKRSQICDEIRSNQATQDPAEATDSAKEPERFMFFQSPRIADDEPSGFYINKYGGKG